jgi:VWFA-related protein
MRRHSLLVIVSAVVLLLIAADGLRSQIRARVDLVVVPVSVRDSNGFLVTDLEREDFTVLEDDKPQTITNFSLDPQPLSAVVVIDDGISGLALKRLVPLLPSIAAAFSPDDEMASFRYDHVVWKLSDFTSDREQLEKSFGDLIRIAETRPDEPEPPPLIAKVEEKTPGWVRAIAGLFTIGSNGPPQPIPSATTQPRAAPGSRTMHTAIYEAADALQGRPEERRKIIMLISDGAVSEPQSSPHSFNRNIDLLVRNQIQVFSVYTLANLLDSSFGMLNSYAQATGGDVYGGRSESDMQFALSRITEQARSQYVLGYVSSNSAPPQGVYRKIEVRSGDADQKRKVVHRQGYMQYPIPR